MMTLRDVLIALRELDVEPSEITISPELFSYFIQQAREIVAEEGEDEELSDENGDKV